MKYRLVIGWFELFAKYEDGTVSQHPLVRLPYPWLLPRDDPPSLEAAARQVVAVVADEMTPKEWAFDTHPRLRQAIIDLEDALKKERVVWTAKR